MRYERKCYFSLNRVLKMSILNGNKTKAVLYKLSVLTSVCVQGFSRMLEVIWYLNLLYIIY